MPAELLRDVSRSVSGPRRRWSMLPVSMGAHALAAVAVLVIPLTAEVIPPDPAPLWMPHFLVSIAPPPPPLAREYATAVRQGRARALAPVRAPTGVEPEKPAPTPVPPGVEVVEGGLHVAYGVPDGIGAFGGPTGLVVAPPPPPPPPPPKTGPLRVGHGVKEPRKTVHVPPAYPAIARDNGVDGVVILEATINERGAIENVRVIRSVPLLDPAAIEAVRQWRYTPTLLNGVPVPVLLTIRVHFTLQR